MSQVLSATQVARWALVIPGAVAAWWLAFILGIGVYVGVEKLCPSNQMQFGHCTASWFVTAEYAALAFGAAMAAALVMTTCVALAPTHKRHVAITTFVAGAIVAVFMGVDSFLLPMVAAIVTGALVLVILLRRLPPFPLPNTSLERTRGR